MTVIVRDNGFHPDDLQDTAFVSLEEFSGEAAALDLPNDTDVAAVAESIKAVPVIRIPFPSFADGRGFSLARRLRMLGYKGRLRAAGHVISDQYDKARRAGFDEVEISDELAARQPQEHWLKRSNWDRPSYQEILRVAQ